MNVFKAYSLFNKISVNSQYRQIQTNTILLNRHRKSVNRKNNKPSVSQWNALADDIREDQFFQSEEDDYDPDDIDYTNLDKAYDEHIQEKIVNKRKLSQAIIKSKFFSVGKQPTMLTIEERENIKFLHNKDPVNWDIQTLSENFPATPQIINKILKSNWKPHPEKIAKMDENVRRNWELLEKNELDADPELIKHLKKFVNRRNVLFANISTSNLCLPEPKKEEVFKNTEISNIIIDFEKKIEKLEALQKKSLEEGSESNSENFIKNSKEEQSSLEKLHSEIKKKVEMEGLETKESFILGEAFKAFGKNLTFEEFQNNILRKAEEKKKLDLSEKAILENKLGTSVNYKDYSAVNQTHGSHKYVLNEKDEESPVNKSYMEVLENKIDDETKGDSTICDSRLHIKNNQHQFKRFQKNYYEDHEELPMPDERTVFISSELEIGKLINKSNSPESTSLKSEPDVKIKPKKKFLEETPEKLESQKVFFNKQMEDIKNTAFWNSNQNSEEKKLVEINKPSLPEKDIKLNDSKPDVYPSRIKIPKIHRGSGLTFKVNDCYYDDDGEFLYRVPGMVN